MKWCIGMAIAWLILALLGIPLIESWSFLPDGSCNHWWSQLGIQLFIAGLHVEIAVLNRPK